MPNPYIDLHTHTTRSDGRLSPHALVSCAYNEGIRTLSITDHNFTEDLSELRELFPDMNLIQGSEISALYHDMRGKEHELHVVALGFDRNNPKMQHLLEKNQPDRRPKIEKILAKLRDCGIDLGSYDDIALRRPESTYIGRMALARCMFEDGYVSSVDQAFNLYLGAHGERRAYVASNLQYATLEEVVATIIECGGIPVLAHILYYKMDDAENVRLVKRFKELSGKFGAMEVYYSRYNDEQRQYCKSLCEAYNLMPSAASDYHAQENWETLANAFPASLCIDLLRNLTRG